MIVYQALTIALGFLFEFSIVVMLGWVASEIVRDWLAQRRRRGILAAARRQGERLASLDHDDEDPHPLDPNTCRCPECLAFVASVRDYLEAETIYTLPSVEEQQ